MPEPEMVSVVMPAYNSARTLAESIESVLAQTWGDLELLIVDDGSSDDSAGIAESYAATSPRVRVWRGGRRGVVAARNLATRNARGRFIAYCDSDDLWHPEKVARQLAFMKACGSAMSATAFVRIDEEGKPISGVVPVPRQIDYGSLLATNHVCCASVMYDTAALGKVYMQDYRESGRLPFYMRFGRMPLHEDYIAWATILRSGRHIDGFDEPLTYYRVRAQSHSANKLAAAVARWYINANVLELPIGQNVARFTQYAVGALWRRGRWRVSAKADS